MNGGLSLSLWRKRIQLNAVIKEKRDMNLSGGKKSKAKNGFVASHSSTTRPSPPKSQKLHPAEEEERLKR